MTHPAIAAVARVCEAADDARMSLDVEAFEIAKGDTRVRATRIPGRPISRSPPDSEDAGRYHFARIAIATTETLEHRWIDADPSAWSKAMGIAP